MLLHEYKLSAHTNKVHNSKVSINHSGKVSLDWEAKMVIGQDWGPQGVNNTLTIAL